MKIGVVLPQAELGRDRETVARFAQHVEQLGFAYLVAYDHVVGADRSTRPDWNYSYDSSSQFHEPFVLFGYLAALTSLELVTGVLVLPQRQTALVAKQAAEIDILTAGRFRLGIGIGWNSVEFDALGVPFHSRARRYDEQIAVLRQLWTEDVVAIDEEFHHIDRAGICPRPVQLPIPIWLGGATSRPTLDRIGKLSDGWITLGPPRAEIEDAFAYVRDVAHHAGRSAQSVGLQGTAQPAGNQLSARPHTAREITHEMTVLSNMVDQWRNIGASHVSISGLGAARSPEDHLRFVQHAARILEL